MYHKDGVSYYVVDGHVHYWNASPENRNKYGEGFIECFYNYQTSLSPAEWIWPYDKFCKYTEQDMIHDLFETGYVDTAIFQPTYLRDFYPGEGFNTTERNAVLKERHPDRFVLNGSFDPRDGDEGLRVLEEQAERYGLRGVKLYTAEWKGDSKGYKLSDPAAYRYLEKCRELGIVNVHVHKGPTIWPLNRDAFDVADIDDVATAFPDLNFIVEHVGLPRLEDFCWIATQEPNVYGGLAVAMPFIHTRPRYFAQIIGELLYWLGEDKLLFASDYAIWSPRWLVERFVDFQIPEDMQGEYGTLSVAAKKRILGLNAAALYDLKVPAEAQLDSVPAGATAGGGS
ncbi:amidohydrolase family protein [Acrocarpospora catenulata]|uniref:amidohydrolase family protein n=1 Tax=Acrocarpospora catenulata TaxID=2836182 RepID=UPI001BDA913D|nr:amidohydrolase family protein [Acrocarpospora catenulata]